MSKADLDVRAVLAAAFRPPTPDRADQLAARVRSRLALGHTLAEAARLLVEAPAFAVKESITTRAESEGEDP